VSRLSDVSNGKSTTNRLNAVLGPLLGGPDRAVRPSTSSPPQELNEGGIQSRDHPPRSTPRLRYRYSICTGVEERREQYSSPRTPAPAGHEDRNEGGHTLRQLTRRSLQLLVLQIPCLMPHERGRISMGSVKSQTKTVTSIDSVSC
jgi:hypothetical protein